MRSLFALVILVGIGAGGVYAYRQAAKPEPRTFRTVSIERGDLSAVVTATGTAQPEEVVDVGAQVQGKIENLGRDPRDPNKSIDYGTNVDDGTVLAQIDDATYRAQVDRIKADLLRAQADQMSYQAKVGQAQRDWDRAQRLQQVGRNAITEADVDAARTALEVAISQVEVGKAAVVQVNADLKLAETNLGYTTIKSPVKGVIIDRRVNVGQTVVASLNAPSLFLIAKDLKRMQVWASVNEADIGKIHPGQPVRFTVDAFGDKQFTGTVKQIRLNATMTQNVVTYTVVVDTDNSSGKLLPYLTANLRFENAKRTGVVYVPNAALRYQPGREAIDPTVREQLFRASDNESSPAKPTRDDERKGTLWVETGDGYVKPIDVKLGLNDGTNTEIFSDTLQPGSKVVIAEIETNKNVGGENPFAPPKMFGGGRSSGGRKGG